MIEITFEIEKNSELLKEYGRTLAHCTAIELLLGEILLIKDKTLTRDRVESSWTLGTRVVEASKRNILSTVKTKLEELTLLRNRVTHGTMAGIGNTYVIYHRGETYPLTVDYLKQITSKADNLFPYLYNEVKKHMIN